MAANTLPVYVYTVSNTGVKPYAITTDFGTYTIQPGTVAGLVYSYYVIEHRVYAGGVVITQTNVLPVGSLPTAPDTVKGKSGSTNYRFIRGEVPAGAVNGINRVFTTALTPDSGGVNLYVNGDRLSAAAGDYQLNGSVLTLKVAPGANNDLLVDYTAV